MMRAAFEAGAAHRKKRMSISRDTPAGRMIVAVVCAALIVMLAGGAIIGYWTAVEMTAVVTEQFNAQQMVLAQTVKARIEREVSGIKHEILLMAHLLLGNPEPRAEAKAAFLQNLPHLAELGVRKVEIADRGQRRVLVNTLHGPWMERSLPENNLYDSVVFPADDRRPLWVSAVQMSAGGGEMVFVVPLTDNASRLLAFHVNISLLVPGLLKNVQSGRTGYAWLIDQNGIFLYHPHAEYIGRDAFSVRQEKYPNVSYGPINFIQKEKMLKGEQGTGWFESSWHRGITGPMRKLIAYCPVTVSDNPAQRWSVAVVAPESEIDEGMRRGTNKLLLILGLTVGMMILGAGGIIWLENRWTRVLEATVLAKTEALMKSEEKYRSLVESAEDFIFTVDREARFQSLNTFTANFFGGPPERFIGRPIADAFSGPEAEELARLIEGVYGSGKSIREEFELRMEERPIWISANFMPVKTDAGEVGTILCIARDITETKSLQRQLVNAEKLASLGTLAAGVAHEINNPLGVILGFCELLLRKTEKGSQQYEDLKTIERQGLLCKETVENLLIFARGAKQKRDVSELNGCILEIVKIVRHLLAKSGIDLILNLAENLPPVKADARQLQQVFLNLVTNAMAAMETGGTLTVQSSLERATRRAVVQIQDTGAGIRPEHMDRIFEPFFTTKPEGQGTGLGLFVSYGIVTSYGGTIECVSTPAAGLGKQSGTTFTVKLLTGSKEDLGTT
jgi:two-component system, NtrC family, sensor kinase